MALLLGKGGTVKEEWVNSYVLDWKVVAEKKGIVVC